MSAENIQQGIHKIMLKNWSQYSLSYAKSYKSFGVMSALC